MISNKSDLFKNFFDTFLVIVVLLYSGNLGLSNIFDIDFQLIVLATFLGFVLIKKKCKFISLDIVIFIIVFTFIFAFQNISFDFFQIETQIGFFTRVFIAYAAIKSVNNFCLSYVRAMVILLLISFFFYFPYIILHCFGISAEGIVTWVSNFLGSISFTRRSVLLHTFLKEFSYRNSGMFWEPGAFQGYLNLALLFLFIFKSKISKSQFNKYFYLISIAVVTTLSTTGYIILFLYILLYFYDKIIKLHNINLKIIFMYVFVFFFSLSGIYFYNNLDFLEKKISYELNIVHSRDKSWYKSRFGSVIFDLEYINKRPLTGWGAHSRTRYALHPQLSSSEGMGNGFSDFVAKFGAIGFLTWFVFVYRSFRHLTKNNQFLSVFFCLIILLELQGECFLGYPIYLGLAFLTHVDNNNIN